MKPFAFRTPIAIPELGADAGDWIDYHPDDPGLVYVIREIPKPVAMETFNRLRSLSFDLPVSAPEGDPRPGLRRLK